MVVRLLVPCWVVNATPLPVSVAVVRMQRPAPPPAADASVHARQPDSLMKAADALHNIRTLNTGYKFRCVHLPCDEQRSGSPSSFVEFEEDVVMRQSECTAPDKP